MEILYQSNVFSSTKITRERQLLAECSIISTDYDAAGQLLLDYHSYRIEEARWEIGRSPGGQHNGSGEALELIGVEAYLDIGSSLRAKVGSERGGLPLELLSECVKAVVQAETFMLLDRGYPTPEAYEEHWDKMYLNSCRYYSNLHRVDGGYWLENAAYRRSLCLFNRAVDCRVIRVGDDCYSVAGGFCDSAHELSVLIDLDREGTVIHGAGNFLRAPDDVCQESVAHIAKLMGRNLTEMNKKDIGGLLGGGQGCVHLVDLVYAIARGAKIVRG